MALQESYAESENNLETLLYDIANKVAIQYYEDNKHDILYSVQGSLIEDYDEQNISVAFRDATATSVAYSLMKRCGIETSEYFEEDFRSVLDFNTPDSVHALGDAVSILSEEVLREIEITIKQYERQKIQERNGIYADYVQTRGGLSDSRNSNRGNERRNRQIRNDEERVSTETPKNHLQLVVPERNIVPSSTGDRQDSERTTGNDDGRIHSTEPTTEQSEQSTRMDGTNAI